MNIPAAVQAQKNQEHDKDSSLPPEALLDTRSIDARFPGILDGLGILGGAANVIMQLSHAPIGYGVMLSKVENGSLFKHPVKRARTTITYLAVALVGSREEKLAYRKAVNGQHAQVRSTSDSPVKYNAFDPELQLWVAACIYWGYKDTRAKLRGGQMPPERNQEFYQLAHSLGTTLQVRQDMWPVSQPDFEAYFEQGLAKANIDDAMRSYLTALTDLKFLSPVARVLFARFNRFVTTGFLPAPLREQMHFAWGDAQQRRFNRFLAVIGAINRIMPRFIRQLPFTLVLRDFRWRLRTGRPLV